MVFEIGVWRIFGNPLQGATRPRVQDIPRQGSGRHPSGHVVASPLARTHRTQGQGMEGHRRHELVLQEKDQPVRKFTCKNTLNMIDSNASLY